MAGVAGRMLNDADLGEARVLHDVVELVARGSTSFGRLVQRHMVHAVEDIDRVRLIELAGLELTEQCQTVGAAG
jgi:hypothetical protein